MRSKRLSQIVFILIPWERKSFSEVFKISSLPLIRFLRVIIQRVAGRSKIVDMIMGFPDVFVLFIHHLAQDRGKKVLDVKAKQLCNSG